MTDKNQKASAGSAQNDSDEKFQRLSKDERMAFEKIISEIGDGSSSPDAGEVPPASEAEDVKEVDDEQQAALDKIMAEINSDGDGDDKAAEPEPAAQAEADTGQETAFPESVSDKQDALPSVTDNAANSEAEGADTEDDENETLSAAPARQLSLEEFNEELNNLLSDHRVNPPSPDSDITTPGQNESAAEKSEEVETASLDDAPVEDDAAQDYAVFHEVTPTQNPKPSGHEATPLRKVSGNRKIIRNLIYCATAAFLVVCIGGGAYWYFKVRDRQPSAAAQLPFMAVQAMETQAQAAAPSADPAKTKPAPPQSISNGTPAEIPVVALPLSPLSALKNDIMGAREQVIDKLEEVKELKAYYENGITEDQDKIRKAMASSGISSFKEAMQHRQIGLRLRSIQRRQLYAAKLEVPIRQLTSASEELLFLKRKSRMFETLSKGISGLALSDFSQEVSIIIGNLLKLSNELAIDDVRVNTAKLESIWNKVKSAEAEKPVSPDHANHAQDMDIGREICQGKFERKYLLTTLGADTAVCLSKWPGKDLYLNGLTQISPSEAEALSQWPGEWLSLNGLKELSAEAAKQLARWNGKRLSLNGVKRLSKRATQYLSEWKGEQLEMVGLESIGRWENYGTRLYLSEKLRRKLQVQ